MNFLIGLMTFVLVVNCALLIFIILIQLPKKESGLGGAAFATGATDALFGAGTGNVLTKVTKYAAMLFLGLSLTLYVIEARGKTGKSGVEKELEKAALSGGPAPAPATPPSVDQPAPAMTVSNFPSATSTISGTNTAPAPVKSVPTATNPPASAPLAAPKQ
jgi:preprotein translocase subunit SecG